MQDENQKYYEALIDMTASDGWRYFVEDIDIALDSINDIKSINDLETLYLNKGRLEILERFKNYRTAIENSYEDFLKDA